MDDAAAEITPHLAPGEKLLWSGRPSPGLYAWNNGAGLIVVGVMLAFGSVAGFGAGSALAVLGLALVVGILLVRKAKSARYGLTDRRAIIATRWPWPAVRSVPVVKFNICLIDGSNDDRSPTTILFRKGLADGWWGRPFEIDGFIGVMPSRELAQLVKRFVAHRT